VLVVQHWWLVVVVMSSRRRRRWREGVAEVIVMVVVAGVVRRQRLRRWLRRLPPVDLGEEMFSSFPEELVSELPSVGHYLPETLQQTTIPNEQTNTYILIIC
jgi:hypothetical protein